MKKKKGFTSNSDYPVKIVSLDFVDLMTSLICFLASSHTLPSLFSFLFSLPASLSLFFLSYFLLSCKLHLLTLWSFDISF